MQIEIVGEDERRQQMELLQLRREHQVGGGEGNIGSRLGGVMR